MENKYLEFKQSGIHNYGAFAVKPIRKGRASLSMSAASDQKNKAALQDNNAYVFTINKHFDIDGEVPWNPARFINHGCEVNAESDVEDDHVDYATRNIKKGEEILYNYNYDLEDAFDNLVIMDQELHRLHGRRGIIPSPKQIAKREKKKKK